MFKGKPILTGSTDLNQIQLIFNLVGSPTEETMPGWTALPGCEGVKTFHPRLSTLATVFRQYEPIYYLFAYTLTLNLGNLLRQFHFFQNC